jgi:hypothetical protein
VVRWQDLEARVDRIEARRFGESVRLSFLKNGTADPARPLINIVAILHSGGDDSFAAGTGMRTRLSASQSELLIDRSTYTGSMPRQGDKVRANDRTGLPWFEVLAVSDRYSNLIVLTLGEV